jgi:hypothetical protein
VPKAADEVGPVLTVWLPLITVDAPPLAGFNLRYVVYNTKPLTDISVAFSPMRLSVNPDRSALSLVSMVTCVLFIITGPTSFRFVIVAFWKVMVYRYGRIEAAWDDVVEVVVVVPVPVVVVVVPPPEVPLTTVTCAVEELAWYTPTPLKDAVIVTETLPITPGAVKSTELPVVLSSVPELVVQVTVPPAISDEPDRTVATSTITSPGFAVEFAGEIDKEVPLGNHEGDVIYAANPATTITTARRITRMILLLDISPVFVRSDKRVSVQLHANASLEERFLV